MTGPPGFWESVMEKGVMGPSGSSFALPQNLTQIITPFPPQSAFPRSSCPKKLKLHNYSPQDKLLNSKTVLTSKYFNSAIYSTPPRFICDPFLKYMYRMGEKIQEKTKGVTIPFQLISSPHHTELPYVIFYIQHGKRMTLPPPRIQFCLLHQDTVVFYQIHILMLTHVPTKEIQQAASALGRTLSRIP